MESAVFVSFFPAKTTFEPSCSVHILKSMMQGFGLCIRCELFSVCNMSVNMFWPIFLVLFILLLFKDVDGFIVTFNKGK